MRIKLFKIGYFTICTLILTSCATSYVSYYGKKVDKVQSITLFSTMIGKIQQPVFPLIDAAIFNAKTNSIADQIIDLQKNNIDHFREIVASSLNRNFNCEILYGPSLEAKTELNEIKINYDFQKALRIDNRHFPDTIF